MYTHTHTHTHTHKINTQSHNNTYKPNPPLKQEGAVGPEEVAVAVAIAVTGKHGRSEDMQECFSIELLHTQRTARLVEHMGAGLRT
jgi:hypothetical protein